MVLGALILSIIGCGGSVGLYYQHLIIKDKQKQEKSDEFYYSELYEDAYKAIEFGKSDCAKYINYMILTEEDMVKDGYSQAEIGIIKNKAINLAKKNFEFIQKTRKEAETAKEFLKEITILKEKYALEEE